LDDVAVSVPVLVPVEVVAVVGVVGVGDVVGVAIRKSCEAIMRLFSVVVAI